MVWCAFLPHLAAAQEAANRIPNAAFEGSQDATGLPEGWHRDTRKTPGVEPSRVIFCRVTGHPGNNRAYHLKPPPGSPGLWLTLTPDRGSSRENIGAQANSLCFPNFFPVGIYGASPGDLAEIRSAGFNAVQSYDSRHDTIRRMAATPARLGLKYLGNVRRDQTDISRELGG